MPVAMERALRRRARKLMERGVLKRKNMDRYVYGTMRKTGWKPKHEHA